MIFFSSNLIACRTAKGWTQEVAAIKISIAAKKDISAGRYQNWELERGEPDYEILAAIVEVFELDDLYLFLVKDLSTKYIHELPSLFLNMGT